MCTTGVLRLGPEEFILFKNKDFGRPHFDDRIVLEPEVFGVEGITTWAGTDPELDRFSGFSIGANAAGVLACDSNVRTLPDHANYDDLVEIALRGGANVESCAEAVEAAAETQPYLWGNLLLAGEEGQMAIEVRGRRTERLPLSGAAARTNHHTRLGVHPDNDDTVTSETRLASAQRRLEQARSVEDVFALLASHDDGDSGVCNHALYRTVYSYVFHRQAGETVLHVRQGSPCAAGEIRRMVLPLGERWSADEEGRFRAAYPSARALAAA